MMPSEPDKKMEELLRTYARKRREDAGEPLELHPATRRLLQAEAAKLRPREEKSERTFWSWLLLRWPRVAFAAGTCALLGVAIWNSIPDRDQSAARTQLAKQDRQEKALSEAPRLKGGAREGLDAPEAQLGARFEQDKDGAKRAEPAAVTLADRSQDEFRVGSSLREAGAQSDVKLKKESETLAMNFQKTPARDLKDAEAEVGDKVIGQQLLVRKLETSARTDPLAAGQAGRLGAPPTNVLSYEVNLALTPRTGANGNQPALPSAAPGGPAAADSYYRLPGVTQASPLTNSAPFFEIAGGARPGATGRPADYAWITPPAAPLPNTSAVPPLNSRDNLAKAGRTDLAVETKDAADLSLAARSRAASPTPGGLVVAKSTTPPPAQPKQSVRFKRQTEPEKPAPSNEGKESAAASVLVTFDVEQDGDRVRLIDTDGSVYTGRFMTGAELGQWRAVVLGEALEGPAQAGAAPRRQSSTTDVSRRYTFGGGLPTSNRVFRASGTNRTFNQLVTIEALLAGGSEELATFDGRGLKPVPTTPAPPAPPAAEPKSRFGAPAAASASAPPSAALLSEARESRRLVGRVSIAGSPESRLIAVPVSVAK